MSSASLTRFASIALAVVAAGACGTSATSSGAPPTTTRAKLALAASGAGGASAKPSADSGTALLYPVRPPQYVLDGTLPDLGASASVRQMNGHSVTDADVTRLAEALGLTGTPTTTPTGWQLQTTDAVLSVDRSNGTVTVSYALGAPGAVGGSPGSTGSIGSSGSSSSSGSGSAPGNVVSPPDSVANGPTTKITVEPMPALPVDVPSAADAQTIARALLDRMGVLAGQDYTTAVDSSDAGVAVSCPPDAPCPMLPPEVSARTVTFSLVVDGRTVDGVGWSVTIGEHSHVQAVYGEWATPAVIGSYPLRSTAAAFADLQNDTAQYAGPQPLGVANDGSSNDAANGAGVATGGVSSGPAIPPGVAPTPSSSEPSTPSTPSTAPPAVVVHITGVTLGIARWDATENGVAVVDLVPTYDFKAVVDGGAPYDIVVLALDPATFTLVHPVPTPEPAPAPAPAPAPEPDQPVPAPLPATVPASKPAGN